MFVTRKEAERTYAWQGQTEQKIQDIKDKIESLDRQLDLIEKLLWELRTKKEDE